MVEIQVYIKLWYSTFNNAVDEFNALQISQISCTRLSCKLHFTFKNVTLLILSKRLLFIRINESLCLLHPHLPCISHYKDIWKPFGSEHSLVVTYIYAVGNIGPEIAKHTSHIFSSYTYLICWFQRPYDVYFVNNSTTSCLQDRYIDRLTDRSIDRWIDE